MILVTGGTGLLGSHLLFSLTENNQKVRAIFRYENSKKIVMDLFNYYNPNDAEKRWARIDWFKADIREIESLHDCFIGVKQVYHCAGLVSFDRKDFKRCVKTNKEGTQNVVNFCLKYGVKKLCHVSSTAAVGENPNGDTNETHLWSNDRLRSSYSVSKHMAEMEVWRGVEEGLNSVIVNPCVIFGPGDWRESSLTIFKSAENGMRFYTSGSNAVVDVRDVVKAMTFLMNSEIHSERFLITGENISFRELQTLIAKKVNKRVPTVFVKKWVSMLFCRFGLLICRLFNMKPMLTPDTINSAYKNVSYDTSKIKKFTGLQFTLLNDTIENTINGRLKSNRK